MRMRRLQEASRRRELAAHRKLLPNSPISITEARQLLCPLLRGVDALPGRKVGITVSGEVAAYLVSAKKLAELEAKARPTPGTPRKSLRGSIEITGELETTSGATSIELERMAVEDWEKGVR